jgi:hypothetical protein
VVSVLQPSLVEHSHVPPESEMIEALTEILGDKEIRQVAMLRSIHDTRRTM